MPKLSSVLAKWEPEQKELFQSVILTLAQHNISDDTTFLASNLEQASRNTGIPIQVLAALRQLLVSGTIKPVVAKERRWIATKSAPLNTLLNGGLRSGDLTEIVSENNAMLEAFVMDIVHGFLEDHPHGHVYHVDTTGLFHTRVLHYTQMPLSRIECRKVFSVAKLNQAMERYSALQIASQRQQTSDQRPHLMVIDDLGYLLDTDWEATRDQVKRLQEMIQLLKSFDVHILASHHLVPTRSRRYEVNLDNMIDLRLILSSIQHRQHNTLLKVVKARHVKTPQQLMLSF